MNIELEFDEEDHEDEVAGSLAIASVRVTDDEIDEDAGPIDDSDSEQSEPEPS